MRVYLEGVGLCGPGLEGWTMSQPILAGAQAYAAAPTSIPPSNLLPANERRRAAQIIKIALAVGTEAFAATAREPEQTATVFTSSGGDGDTIHEILHVLASPNRELSPTRFHNSVHNSAAGYWSIATGAKAASTSLCCHDDSFAAGLLEAVVQVVTQHCAVALIAYDVQYPAPLSELRSIGAPFAVALVLAPGPTPAAFACLDLTLQAGAQPAPAPTSLKPASPKPASPKLASPELELLRQTTPAARSLPLLAALARRDNASLGLPYLQDMVIALNIMPLQPGIAPGPPALPRDLP